jgi:flagellar protein FlaG
MIMVTGVNTDNIPVAVSPSRDGVGKVAEVAAVSPRPKLPGEGKTLPQQSVDKPDAKSSDQQNIEAALREFKQQAQMVQRELHFSIDRESGKTVIKVMDASTQELIRQIPGDEALRFARILSEDEKLELFDSFT